jgi:hypothetical protein
MSPGPWPRCSAPCWWPWAAWAGTGGSGPRWRPVPALLVLLAAIVWRGGVSDMQRMYVLQHGAIHLALAWSFALTLRGGGTPLITLLAEGLHRKLHQDFTPAMHAYTRALTGLWAAYFLGRCPCWARVTWPRRWPGAMAGPSAGRSSWPRRRRWPDARCRRQGPAVNLCQDRYRFALGLAAALLRGQTSLMPPNALPETLRQVPPDGPPPYLLVDGDGADGRTLPWHLVQRLAAAPATAVPEIPAELEAVCLLTSGSTGAPQPHTKRWGQLVPNIAAEADTPGRADAKAVLPASHRGHGARAAQLRLRVQRAAGAAGRRLLRQPAGRSTRPTSRRPCKPCRTARPGHHALPPEDAAAGGRAPAAGGPGAVGHRAAVAAAGGRGRARCRRRLVEIYGCTEAGQVAARRTTAGEVWTTLGELRMWRETARRRRTLPRRRRPRHRTHAAGRHAGAAG